MNDYNEGPALATNEIATLRKERDELAAHVERLMEHLKFHHPNWHTKDCAEKGCGTMQLLNETPDASLAAVIAPTIKLLEEIAELDTAEQPSIASDAKTELNRLQKLMERK